MNTLMGIEFRMSRFVPPGQVVMMGANRSVAYLHPDTSGKAARFVAAYCWLPKKRLGCALHRYHRKEFLKRLSHSGETQL